jgi:hypothetical protein
MVPFPWLCGRSGARKSRYSVMVRHDIVCERFRAQSDALGHDPSERSISRHFTTDYPHIRGSGAARRWHALCNGLSAYKKPWRREGTF